MPAASSPFRSLVTVDGLAKRVERIEKALQHMSMVQADIELRVLYVMHKMSITRKKAGGLIVGASNKVETETITLLDLFEVEKEQFLALMMGREEEQERQEEQRAKDSQSREDANQQLERAQREGAAANAHTNGAGPASDLAASGKSWPGTPERPLP